MRSIFARAFEIRAVVIELVPGDKLAVRSGRAKARGHALKGLFLATLVIVIMIMEDD